ncbi:hypothetical protein BDZ89DRAFT_30617 [Hymenopellis radicata]|nr:hypothetical protein BDZ89DRAFT_30617 [Hymenopellis radicata]
MAVNELKRTREIPAAHRVPQEIIDIIIDHVHSDKKSLSTLALVGRGWLRSARFHLFGVVELHETFCLQEGDESDGSYDSDDSSYNSGTFYSWDNCLKRVHAGLDIVRTSPEIASFIRSVNLHVLDEGSIVRGCEFLSYLPNLRSVSFDRVDWLHVIYPQSFVTDFFVSVAPRVECLSLHDVQFVDTADFLAFVAAFRNVRELSFTRVRWGAWQNGSPPPQPIFRDLPLQSCNKVSRLTQLSFSTENKDSLGIRAQR